MDLRGFFIYQNWLVGKRWFLLMRLEGGSPHEYGRGSCASSFVFIKMWLQQPGTELHKSNIIYMYLLFGVKYDVQNAEMFIGNNVF